jgi:hypothetical protein
MTSDHQYPLIVAAVALSLGALISNPLTHRHGPAGPKSDILIVENDSQPGAAKDENAEDSAKMGKEEGTHTGSNQGAKPESATQKVDQSARKNVPSNDATPQ